MIPRPRDFLRVAVAPSLGGQRQEKVVIRTHGNTERVPNFIIRLNTKALIMKSLPMFKRMKCFASQPLE
jgi:hypothetical protein